MRNFLKVEEKYDSFLNDLLYNFPIFDNDNELFDFIFPEHHIVYTIDFKHKSIFNELETSTNDYVCESMNCSDDKTFCCRTIKSSDLISQTWYVWNFVMDNINES